MQDIELTPQIYSSPVQIREKHITGPIYKHLYQKIYAYMQIVITETDNDVIGFEGLSNIKTEKILNMMNHGLSQLQIMDKLMMMDILFSKLQFN